MGKDHAFQVGNRLVLMLLNVLAIPLDYELVKLEAELVEGSGGCAGGVAAGGLESGFFIMLSKKRYHICCILWQIL